MNATICTCCSALVVSSFGLVPNLGRSRFSVFFLLYRCTLENMPGLDWLGNAMKPLQQRNDAATVAVLKHTGPKFEVLKAIFNNFDVLKMKRV